LPKSLDWFVFAAMGAPNMNFVRFGGIERGDERVSNIGDGDGVAPQGTCSSDSAPFHQRVRGDKVLEAKRNHAT